MHQIIPQLSSRGMLHCSLAGMVAALLSLAICAQAAGKPLDDAADVNAIRANIESYVAAYNRGDAERSRALERFRRVDQSCGRTLSGKAGDRKGTANAIRREQGRANRSSPPGDSPRITRRGHRGRHGPRPSLR